MNETTEILELRAVIGGSARTNYSFAYEWDMEVPVGLSGDAKHLLQKGFGETLRDKFSVFQKSKVLANGKKVKVDTSPEEKDEYTRARLEDLKAGRYPWKDSDSVFIPQTGNLDAWLAYYKARGVKISKRPVSKKTLHEAQMGECRAALVRTNPDLASADNLTEQAEALLPNWIAEQEADMTGVGGFIALFNSMNSKGMADDEE